MYHEFKKGDNLFTKPSKFDVWMETEGKLIKKEIEKNGHKCFVCSSRNHLEFHHVVPKHLGGTDLKNNLVRLCSNCHKQVHVYQRDRKNINEMWILKRLEMLRLENE